MCSGEATSFYKLNVNCFIILFQSIVAAIVHINFSHTHIHTNTHKQTNTQLLRYPITFKKENTNNIGNISWKFRLNQSRGLGVLEFKSFSQISIRHTDRETHTLY